MPVLTAILALAAGMAVFMIGNRDAGIAIADMNYHETAADNKVYTSYSQRDTCWDSSSLGTFKNTTGSSGCLTSRITASLAAQRIYGSSSEELNQVFDENNAYNGQSSIVRRELEQVLPYAKVRLDCGTTSESINRLLEEEMYPIVKVRRKSGIVHWIMFTGTEKDTHDITAMNPIGGLVRMSDYNNYTYGVRIVTGSVETPEINGACL